MLVVGLTGGIACGKSTVSRRLVDTHKLPLIDADQIARDVVKPGQKAYTQIVEYFESKVDGLVLADMQLNRAALGKWVFAHPDDLKVLNGITHPAIRYVIVRQMAVLYAKGYRMCVLDVPLLFEGGLDAFCGVTVSVVCLPEVQLARLRARNPELSLQDATNRISSQMSREERIDKSDFVLENDKDLPHLYAQIDTLVDKLKPSLLRTALEYFPPFGMVSAVSIVLSKRFWARWMRRHNQMQHSRDKVTKPSIENVN